ncbi:DUF2141 domain-containing protein [Sphingobium aquiterrae]|uniref:DUF2141 domain-containing protein n=1 Tax=Sphingobium aquiterrae TaxID=2038656 RepID=UPI0030193520
MSLSITLARAAVLVPVGLALMGVAPADLAQPLTMQVDGLRSAKGVLRICLTRMPDHFPDCTGDPDKRHYSIPANGDRTLSVAQLPAGSYAIAVIHDENGNQRLDTFAGIPREGVGFSENPPIRFGAPSFRAAHFTVGGGPSRQQVKMRYFL